MEKINYKKLFMKELRKLTHAKIVVCEAETEKIANTLE